MTMPPDLPPPSPACKRVASGSMKVVGAAQKLVSVGWGRYRAAGLLYSLVVQCPVIDRVSGSRSTSPSVYVCSQPL
jgi:hypothetical protein